MINSTAAAELIRNATGRKCTRQNLEKLCRAGRLPRSCVSQTPIRLDPDHLVDEYVANVDARQVGARSAPSAAPRERHVPAAAPPDGTPDYNESRARAEYEKANLLELERKQKEGELLERKATLEGWANMITIAKTKFTAVPSRAKSMIPHLTVEDVQTLTRLVDEALTEVCNADGC
jgi:hypothetical protein